MRALTEYCKQTPVEMLTYLCRQSQGRRKQRQVGRTQRQLRLIWTPKYLQFRKDTAMGCNRLFRASQGVHNAVRASSDVSSYTDK